MIQEITEQSSAIESLCKRFRVRRLELFGSAAAGGFNPQSSDLDFLVEFDTLRANEYADAYFGLLEALEKLFERKVDLVVSGSVKNPYLKESIERSRTLLYAEGVLGLRKRCSASRSRRAPVRARVIAFRNILVHGYAEIDDRVVWDIVQSKLPTLILEVESLLG